MEIHDLLAGVVVLVGLFGIVAVFLPGIALQAAAILIWALEESSVVGWVVFALVVAIAGSTSLLKYVFPGRRLRAAGVPRWVLLAAVGAAFLGLFVIPIVGAPLGFVLTVYVFERVRLHDRRLAWPSTRRAVRAVLASIGIELAGGFLIVIVFVGGALLT